MALKISAKSISQAKSLIKAGKINTTGSWGFDSSDRNALLKSVNNDWSKYAAWFLVYDDEAKEDTFQRYKYPYGKQGKVWRRGVIAVKTRAAQNNWSELANIADNLLQMIDEKEEKGFSQSSEYRVFPIQELRVEDDEKDDRRYHRQGHVPRELPAVGAIQLGCLVQLFRHTLQSG